MRTYKSILFTGCLLLSISTPIVLSRPDVSIPEGFDKTTNPSAIDEAERIGSQKKVVAFSDSPTEWLSRQLRLDNNEDFFAAINALPEETVHYPQVLTDGQETIDLRHPVITASTTRTVVTATGNTATKTSPLPLSPVATESTTTTFAADQAPAMTLEIAETIVSSSSSATSSSDGASNKIGNLRRTIPGEPNVDYPIFSQPPHSSFRCTGRHDGYYADVEARCQVFRVCANTDLSGHGFAFLCPNGTLFNQRFFVCDWYQNVDCSTSEQFYDRNVGKQMSNDHAEMMQKVKEMIEFPLNQPFMANLMTTSHPVTTTTADSSGGLPTTRTSPLEVVPHNLTPTRPPSTPALLPATYPSTVVEPPRPTTGQPLRLPTVPGLNMEKDLPFPTDTHPGNSVAPERTPTSTTHQYQPTLTPPPPFVPSPSLPPFQGTTNTNIPPTTTTGAASDADVVKDNTNAVTQTADDQKVYVSSLGELSTDLNSGFDINKSKFLVVNSAEKKLTEDEARKADVLAEKHRLEKILEEQVALVGHSINSNGLTQQAQINQALLKSTNRFATPPAPLLQPTTFLPRLIASNVIVPLPKGFTKTNGLRKKQEQQLLTTTVSVERPTYTASGLQTRTKTGQFPAEQFSFPIVGVALALARPSEPTPFTVVPAAAALPSPSLASLLELSSSPSSNGEEKQSIGHVSPIVVNPLADAGHLQPMNLLVHSAERGKGEEKEGAGTVPSLSSRSGENRTGRVSLLGAFKVDPLKTTENNDFLRDQISEKQKFTYPSTEEEEEQRKLKADNTYSDTSRLSVFVPDHHLQAPLTRTEQGENREAPKEERRVLVTNDADPEGTEDSAVAGSENDQQIANSAVRQIVFRTRGNVKYGHPQQVTPSSDANGHVPSAQSRAFTLTDEEAAAEEFEESGAYYRTQLPEQEQSFGRSHFSQGILNNNYYYGGARGGHQQADYYSNFNSINAPAASHLPRILPSVTQSFQRELLHSHHSSRGAETEGNGNEERVDVKIVPAVGFALNDPREREAYFEAVKRGLLDDNGAVFVNKVRPSQHFDPQAATSYIYRDGGVFGSQPQMTKSSHLFNFNSLSVDVPQQNKFHAGPSQNQLLANRVRVEDNFYNNQHLNSLQFNSARSGGNNNFQPQHQQQLVSPIVGSAANEEAYDIETRPSIFKGFNSYSVPINSVGRLENDSDSVTGSFNFIGSFRNRRRAKDN